MLFQQGALFSALTVRQKTSFRCANISICAAGGDIAIANSKWLACGFVAKKSVETLRRHDQRAALHAPRVDPEIVFLDERLRASIRFGGRIRRPIKRLQQTLGLTVFMVPPTDSLTLHVPYPASTWQVIAVALSRTVKSEHPC